MSRPGPSSLEIEEMLAFHLGHLLPREEAE